MYKHMLGERFPTGVFDWPPTAWLQSYHERKERVLDIKTHLQEHDRKIARLFGARALKMSLERKPRVAHPSLRTKLEQKPGVVNLSLQRRLKQQHWLASPSPRIRLRRKPRVVDPSLQRRLEW